MNICVLTRALPVHSVGGMELNSLRLAQHLASLGHSIQILTTCHPKYPNKDVNETIGGVEITYVGTGVPGSYSREWSNGSVSAFSLMHKEKPFDIVHSHNSAALQLHRSGFIRRYRIPHVVTWHGTHLDWIATTIRSEVLSGDLRYIVRAEYLCTVMRRLLFEDLWLTRAASAVIAIDQEMVDKIRLQYMVPRGRIHMIPTGIDTETFSPRPHSKIRIRLGLETHQPVLLGVGRLIREKGFERSIAAMPYVLEEYPSARLLIVGDGPERCALKQRVQLLGISHAVLFVGAVPPEQCPDYFSACDIFVNPIVQISGFNTTLGEAMACERAVITSAGGGTGTLVHHGTTGLLIPMGSVSALVEAVLRLLRDEKLRESLGKAARERVLSKFGCPEVARRTDELYRSVRDQQRSRRYGRMLQRRSGGLRNID